MEKLIISVGITGSRITRRQTPHIPITPEEIVLRGECRDHLQQAILAVAST